MDNSLLDRVHIKGDCDAVHKIISKKVNKGPDCTVKMSSKKGEKVDLSALRAKGAIIWGKLPGFPVWPCRFTSKAEEDNLSSKKAKSSKMDQVAVVFLGKYLEK